MPDKKYVLLTEPVTLQGGRVEADEVIELTAKSAQALIEEGKAVEATPDGETKEALDKIEGEGQEQGAEQTETGQDDAGETSEGENTPQDEEAVEKLKKALDDQYKRDEIAEAAKAAGVEFAYDDRKAEIIEAVVASGKGEALLK